MQCPRRVEIGNDAFNYPIVDSWRDARPVQGMNGGVRTCSYCGSMHNDAFMEFVRSGGLIIPTDKSYKVYVECKQPTYFHGKFYFQHLPEEQARVFVDMMNAKTMNIGHPGHFYVKPFFCAPAGT